MTVYGAGSSSSPIVISDDEDEAIVELELEQRLSSPREGMELQYDDDYQGGYFYEDSTTFSMPQREQQYMDSYPHGTPKAHYTHDINSGAVNGHKRKRNDSPVSPRQRQHTSGAQPLPTRPRSPSPGAPPGETKKARKRRRRQENMEARNAMQQSMAVARQNFAMAGPSTDVNPYIPADIPGLSSLTHFSPISPSFAPLHFSLSSSLPPKPMLYQDFPMVIPPLPPPDMHFPMSAYSLPLPPQPPPMPSFPLPFVNLPPSPNFQHQFDVPAPPPQPAVAPQAADPATEPPQKPPAVRKTIGMAPDADPGSQHGTYTSPSPTFPPPNPARTLVMELLPKKFRTQAFVRGWASKFGTLSPRVDLNVKVGKALIEFPSAEVARTAWESDRLAGEGKEHIRLWWYRVPGVGADAGVGELEEGEIGDGEVAEGSTKRTQTTKVKETKKKKGKNVAEPLPPRPQQPVAMAVPAPSPSPAVGPSSFSNFTFTSPPNGVTVARHQPPVLPHLSLPPKPVTSNFPSATSSVTLSASTPKEPPQKPFPHQVSPTNSAPQPRTPTQTVPPVPSSTSQGSLLQATAPPFVPKAQRAPPINNIASMAPAPILPPPQASSDLMDTSSDSPPHTPLAALSIGNEALNEATRQTISAVLFTHSNGSIEDDDHSISSSRPDSPVADTRAEAPIPPATTLLVQSPVPKPATSALVQNGRPVTNYPGAKPNLVSVRTPLSTLPNAISTPTPPPSEPRATRNAPKVPSHAKRKEVEELMARRREEQATRSPGSASGTATPVSEVEAMIVDGSSVTSKESSPPTPTPGVVDLASAMKEDDLRRLVLSSRRAKNASATGSPTVTPSNAEAPPSFVAAVATNEVEVQPRKLSLDDMAASFIAQSIQAVTIPTPTSAQASLVSPIFSEKALLSAKQKIYERNIADQKELFAQYNLASTKADKNRLKKAMAECTRVMQQELDAVAARARAGREAARTLRFKWPETDKNACILVISDDEDD